MSTADIDTPAADAAEQKPFVAPADRPGDWYVINTYSGHEAKVCRELMARVESMHAEEKIFEVAVPTTEVSKIKGGVRQTVDEKMFPGYVLVRMYLDDESWFIVRNTPGVTGFVSADMRKPSPLSRRDVEKFLGGGEIRSDEVRVESGWKVGQKVRVVNGAFTDFDGVISEVHDPQGKVVVLVNIFGRDTPVEMSTEDIEERA